MNSARHLGVVGENAAGGSGPQQSPSAAPLQPHPASFIFPPMTDTEFKDLCDDITKHGLVDPIILLDGQVLEGNHRHRACLQTGTIPRFAVWEGDDPIAYVLSKNLHRRHLTNLQRSAVAVEAEALYSRPMGRPTKSAANSPDFSPGQALKHAAKAVGSNRRTAQDAKRVKAADPNVFKEIKNGKQTSMRAAQRAAGILTKDGKTHRPQDVTQTIAPVAPPVPAAKPINDLAKIRQLEDETKYAAMLNAPPGDVPNIPLVDRVNRLFEIVGELIAMPAEKAAGHLHARIVHRYAFPEIGQWLIDFAEACEKRRLNETPDLDRKIYRPTLDNINPVILGTETLPADEEWQLNATERISLRWLRKQNIEVTAKSAAVGMKMSLNGARLRLDTLVQRGFAEKWADKTRTTFYRVKML